MRFIPTAAHAALDYLGGFLLIAIPLILMGPDTRHTAAYWVPVAVGAMMIVQSLFTDYEISLAPVLPVSAHLSLDALAGLFLIASPWLFGFAEFVWAPHVILGLGEIGAALTTKLHREAPSHDDIGGGTRIPT